MYPRPKAKAYPTKDCNSSSTRTSLSQMILKTWMTHVMRCRLPWRVGIITGTWVKEGRCVTPGWNSWRDPGANGFPELDCQMRTPGHQWSPINARLITPHPLLEHFCSSSTLSMTPGSSAQLSWPRPTHSSSWKPALLHSPPLCGRSHPHEAAFIPGTRSPSDLWNAVSFA